MCGIVGYVGARCAQNVLLDGLTKLEYRGYDSAGLALAVNGGIRVIKSKGRLTALRAKLQEATAAGLPAAHCGIGHTRWATQGEPSDVNSHPHSTPYVSIVHNGIIENYGALKAMLETKGYTFVSETDTEVLVKLIDSCYHGEPLRALAEALARVRGSYGGRPTSPPTCRPSSSTPAATASWKKGTWWSARRGGWPSTTNLAGRSGGKG